MNEKIISIRLNEKNLKAIETIRQGIATFYKQDPEEITNTQVIKYSIGLTSDIIINNKTTG